LPLVSLKPEHFDSAVGFALLSRLEAKMRVFTLYEQPSWISDFLLRLTIMSSFIGHSHSKTNSVNLTILVSH